MDTPKRRSVLRKNSSDRKLWDDEVLTDVYAARDAYSAEQGHDLDRIYADLKRRERASSLPRLTPRQLTREG